MYTLTCSQDAQAKIRSIAKRDPAAYVEIDEKATMLSAFGIDGELHIGSVQQNYSIYLVGTISSGPALLILQETLNPRKLYLCDLIDDLPVDAVERAKLLRAILQKNGFPFQDINLGPY